MSIHSHNYCRAVIKALDTELATEKAKLLIALEALETGRTWDGPVQVIHGLNGEALRRIASLGDTQQGEEGNDLV